MIPVTATSSPRKVIDIDLTPLEEWHPPPSTVPFRPKALSPTRWRDAGADVTVREPQVAEKMWHSVPRAVLCPRCDRTTRTAPLPRTDDMTHGWVCPCGLMCLFGGRFGGHIAALPLFGPGTLVVRTWSNDQEVYGAPTRMPSFRSSPSILT